MIVCPACRMFKEPDGTQKYVNISLSTQLSILPIFAGIAENLKYHLHYEHLVQKVLENYKAFF